VIGLQEEETLANFAVKPRENPQEKSPEGHTETKHFFTHEATSTFQVELHGNRIVAKEIGQDEVVNNQGEEAGSRQTHQHADSRGRMGIFPRRYNGKSLRITWCIK
jgi:hypothetical protein